MQTFLEDESFTIKSRKEINPYLFRTPQNFVITSHAPEKKFVVELCNKDNAKNLISWIKSRDVGFYEIEYSYRFHNHQKQKKFNPDFFIKFERNGKIFYLVVEIKDDDDDSIENKAKYKYGKIHFENLIVS